MKKRTRFVIILAVLAICYYFVTPSIKWYMNTTDEQKKVALQSREDIKAYSEAQAKNLAEAIKADPETSVNEALVKAAVRNYKNNGTVVPEVLNGKAVYDAFGSEAAFVNAASNVIGNEILSNKGAYANSVKLGLDLSGGTNLIVKANLESLDYSENENSGVDEEQAKKDAMAQAVEELSSRLDRFGLTSPVIRQQGEDHLYIEIPGEEKDGSIKTILSSSSVLNFRLVDDEATDKFKEYFAAHSDEFFDKETGKLLADSEGAVKVDMIKDFPANCSVYGEYKKDNFGLDALVNFHAVKNEIIMDGSRVKSVTVGQNQETREIEVDFRLDTEGSNIFADVTGANVGKKLAIVSDGKIKSAANIRQRIAGGAVSISGSFSRQEAIQLQKVLQSTAMRVPLELETSQHVDATLGKVAQAQGAKALIVGLALVLVFMIVYYKGAGFNALVAQIFNMFIMFAVLSAFNLTLSLSSIAGMILTVGMSVDANVIIFERIKEELREGKSRAVAIASGFDNALWAILDSNITTFIAAIFLAKLGTGSIQGFAVSLAIGVCSSVFTALVVSRLLFDFNTEVLKKDKMSIGWGIN